MSHTACAGRKGYILGGRTRILKLRAGAGQELSAEASSAVAILEHVVTTTLPEFGVRRDAIPTHLS